MRTLEQLQPGKKVDRGEVWTEKEREVPVERAFTGSHVTVASVIKLFRCLEKR